MKKDHSKSLYNSTTMHMGSIAVGSSSRQIQETKRVRCGAPQAFTVLLRSTTPTLQLPLDPLVLSRWTKRFLLFCCTLTKRNKCMSVLQDSITNSKDGNSPAQQKAQIVFL